MDNNIDIMDLEIAIVIVNFGSGSRVLKIAKRSGIQGGVVTIGQGTVRSHFLEFLELADIRKEIVMLVSGAATINTVLDNLDNELNLSKPNHGIAFTMPVSDLCVTGKNPRHHHANGGEYEFMYQSIIVVVERGKTELVMDAARGAGARGGTVMKARGAGSYESNRLFHMDIEPEKEIVMILATAADAEKIVGAIRCRMDEDGAESVNGVIICHDVRKVYGVSNTDI